MRPMHVCSRGFCGISGGTEIALGQRLPAVALHFKPAVIAVQALADARGWLCWLTGAFHAPTRAPHCLRAVCLTHGLYGAVPRMFSANPCALTPSPKMRRLFGPPVWLLQRALPTRATPPGFEAWNEKQTLQVWSMCNLYSITMNQAAIRNLFVCTIPLVR
jgi:hypothetical protein